MTAVASGDAPRLTVVLGITGGIAAYKAVGVARMLVQAGHDVHIVATTGALRFVGRPTLEAISRNPVHSDLYEGVAEVRHVALGQKADVIVVAPATAHTIASLAAGLASDLLGTTVLASTAPLIIAPAMHTEMWLNAATVANIDTLTSRGVVIVGPESGQLTGADSGVGRMSEPATIVAAALAAAGPRDMIGRRVLISAGGTREAIDPVRFLGNRSSGRQGIALAAAAAARGATVTVVAAHLEVQSPAGVELVQVSNTAEMAAAMRFGALTADIVIMAAAVADYRPATVSDAKVKKDSTGGSLTLELVQNPDILAELTGSRRPGQVFVGFAAETEADDASLERMGAEKARRKGVDVLVVNRVGWNQGFGSDHNTVAIIDGDGSVIARANGDKLSVAHRILDLLAPSSAS